MRSSDLFGQSTREESLIGLLKHIILPLDLRSSITTFWLRSEGSNLFLFEAAVASLRVVA